MSFLPGSFRSKTSRKGHSDRPGRSSNRTDDTDPAQDQPQQPPSRSKAIFDRRPFKAPISAMLSLKLSQNKSSTAAAPSSRSSIDGASNDAIAVRRSLSRKSGGASRRSSSAHNSFTLGTPTTPSFIARVPSMPDLTPLPSPIVASAYSPSGRPSSMNSVSSISVSHRLSPTPSFTSQFISPSSPICHREELVNAVAASSTEMDRPEPPSTMPSISQEVKRDPLPLTQLSSNTFSPAVGTSTDPAKESAASTPTKLLSRAPSTKTHPTPDSPAKQLRQPRGLSHKRSVSFNNVSEFRNKVCKVEPLLHRELHLILPQRLKISCPEKEKEVLFPLHSSSFRPVEAENSTVPTPTVSSAPESHMEPLKEEEAGNKAAGQMSTTSGRHDSAVSSEVPSAETQQAVGSPEQDAAENLEVFPSGSIVIKDASIAEPLKYNLIRLLGKGTFSNVMLASDASKKSKGPALVAIKIVALQPAGGASEERVELGLQREVDIIKSLDHPSIVKLHAFEIENRPDNQAAIVLDYCRGGDLFELATQHPEVLTATLVRRIFAELTAAVRYLHSSWVVHRDIKLENILVNYAFDELPSDPLAPCPPLISLTDLGLSRRIPEPPADLMLTTRCGSEDYAAPEIIMGERYDGRLTDAWACGVVLYALLEARLPFDPPPHGPGSHSRVSHRIAVCKWSWYRFGAKNGQWVGSKPEDQEAAKTEERDWRGARDIVGELLKKVSKGRLTLEQVSEMDWIRGVPTSG